MSKLRLIQTVLACPRLYAAFLGDEEVGYIRERHGRWWGYCRDVLVYKVEHRLPDARAERDYHLSRASRAILDSLGQEPPPVTEDCYVLEKELRDEWYEYGEG